MAHERAKQRGGSAQQRLSPAPDRVPAMRQHASIKSNYLNKCETVLGGLLPRGDTVFRWISIGLSAGGTHVRGSRTGLQNARLARIRPPASARPTRAAKRTINGQFVPTLYASSGEPRRLRLARFEHETI